MRGCPRSPGRTIELSPPGNACHDFSAPLGGRRPTAAVFFVRLGSAFPGSLGHVCRHACRRNLCCCGGGNESRRGQPGGLVARLPPPPPPHPQPFNLTQRIVPGRGPAGETHSPRDRGVKRRPMQRCCRRDPGDPPPSHPPPPPRARSGVSDRRSCAPSVTSCLPPVGRVPHGAVCRQASLPPPHPPSPPLAAERGDEQWVRGGAGSGGGRAVGGAMGTQADVWQLAAV